MLNIESISALHELLGYEKPKHPLITLINLDEIHPAEEYFGVPFTLNFYMISLKNNPECELKYGRQYYDFSEGSLIFTAPGQVLTAGESSARYKTNGWMLCVHSDLLRDSSLWDKMDNYTFFEYAANEALHLSESEKEIVTGIVKLIQTEYSQNIDVYSRDLLVSNLEVLLNYSKRFYGRQFITRTTVSKDTIAKFEILLKEQCSAEMIARSGIPSVKGFAQVMGYSPNYLSDMLKKETGKTTQEHIKSQVLQLAKTLLVTTNEPVYHIGYILGIEHPASFTKFFKTQTGISPVSFRKQRTV